MRHILSLRKVHFIFYFRSESGDKIAALQNTLNLSVGMIQGKKPKKKEHSDKPNVDKVKKTETKKSKGLFDDSDDDLIADAEILKKPASPRNDAFPNSDKESDIFKSNGKQDLKVKENGIKKQVLQNTDSLFDLSDDEISDIFSQINEKNSNIPKIPSENIDDSLDEPQSSHTTRNKAKSISELFRSDDDSSDDIFRENTKKSKSAAKSKGQDYDKVLDDKKPEEETKSIVEKESKDKVISTLFDDTTEDDSLFGSPLKKSRKSDDSIDDISEEKPKTVTKLGGNDNNKASHDKKDSANIRQEKSKSKVSLFDESPEEDSLFGSPEKQQKKPHKVLFSESSSQSNDNIFADNKPKATSNVLQSAIDASNDNAKKSKNFDVLFESDDDDIFGISPSPNKPKVKPPEDIFVKNVTEAIPKSSTNTKSKPVLKSHKPKSIFDDSDSDSDNLSFDKKQKAAMNDIFKDEPVQQSNAAEILATNKTETAVSTPSSSSKTSSSIAKLRSNLNFNPAMLMGGKAPVKKRKETTESTDNTDGRLHIYRFYVSKVWCVHHSFSGHTMTGYL